MPKPPVTDGAELCRSAFQEPFLPMPTPVAVSNPPLRHPRHTFGSRSVELVGESAAVRRVDELIRRAASADGGVLITAEPGVAVESIAYEIHARGRGSRGPYVTVECQNGDAARIDRLLCGATDAPPDSDLETVSSDSRVASARGGTLYLRDIIDLPAAVQAKLARIVRDDQVLIDGVAVALSWRLVASSAPSIDADVQAHRFRLDLCRRVSTTRIDLPSLRERPEDVPAIAIRLLEDICQPRRTAPRTFTNAALALVGAISWPGNVAELRAALERVVADSDDEVIQIEHLLPVLRLQAPTASSTPLGNLRDARLKFEREYVTSVLQHCGWRMADAARALGMQRPNLYRKARQLGIPLMRATE